MYSLYPIALDAGIPPERFWRLSIAEVRDILESYKRVRQSQQKERINIASYIVSELGVRISIMLGNKEMRIGHVWDYFPSLYQEEKELADQMQQNEELERIKDSRYNFAAAHNRQWKEAKASGRGTDTTETASGDTGEYGAVQP